MHLTEEGKTPRRKEAGMREVWLLVTVLLATAGRLKRVVAIGLNYHRLVVKKGELPLSIEVEGMEPQIRFRNGLSPGILMLPMGALLILSKAKLFLLLKPAVASLWLKDLFKSSYRGMLNLS
jgi:hypothetical protein